MRQWSALFMKDFKLTRVVFFMGLVMNGLVALLTLTLEGAANDSLLLFVPFAIAAGIHVAYVPGMVLISLKSEGSYMSVWLHNPQAAFKLLLSKMVNGLIMLVVSLAWLYALARLVITPRLSLIEPSWTDAWSVGWFIFPHIIWISAGLSVLVMFLWALHQYLKLRIGRWSWAVIAGILILSGWIYALLTTSKLYGFVTEWGGMTYKFGVILPDTLQTYTGGYVFDFIMIVGLFILTAWLVDNKVEG
ncbi:hypothetical protein EJP77_08285 [Paenibacillus zeisoli]|uniref:Uncharacterized protein n=1 Tax=Paenibacillus zeisoli TaxID=2496267 RepID=A0A3S1DBD0_9BACL|nr:hypothetical protein [Paenibacillus zeisoli]RUT33627.1 hypothetical protein EJP77_08285 [Paenibacillus zeisoli]